MGMRASIYEAKDIGNCSAGGISEKAKAVVIVNIEGPFEPSEDSPAVLLIAHPASSGFAPICVPADENGDPLRPENMIGPMSGGTLVGTSDARFCEALRALRFSGSSVNLHDRFDTPEVYEMMSR